MHLVIFHGPIMVKPIMNASVLQLIVGVQRGLNINLAPGDTVMTIVLHSPVSFQNVNKRHKYCLNSTI